MISLSSVVPPLLTTPFQRRRSDSTRNSVMNKPARTHTALAFTALALAATAALAQGSSKHPMSIDDIMAMKNVGGPAISPNGTLVAFTVAGWEHPGAKS